MANENRPYLAWIRRQPCCACGGLHNIEAHHHTGRKRGLSQKNHDHETMPLCVQCHRDFHSCAGRFRDMNKAQRRAWQDGMVKYYGRRMLIDEEAF